MRFFREETAIAAAAGHSGSNCFFTMVVVVDNRSRGQSGLPRELLPAEVVTLRTVTHSPAGLGLGP